MAFPLINPSHQFFDTSGAPLVSGTLEFRDPTSNALINSYPTADDADAQTNANANPLTLDSRGGYTGLYLEDGVKYKIILKDSSGTTIDTQDDVQCPYSFPYANTTADETAVGVTVVNNAYAEGHILRYGTNTTPGTTDMATALQAAVDVIEYKGGGIVDAKVPTTFALGTTITIDSDGVVIEGAGGHTGQTTLTSTNVTGPVIRIKKRSCGVRGVRIDSDSTRYATTVTDGHGIHVESSDEAQGAGAASSLSRNQFFDLDIRIQPVDGFHNAGGAELITFDTITCSDNKRHGAVFDNGTYSSRTNTDLAPFNFVLKNFRAFENAGNGLILGNSCANGTLINCEGLGNCWSATARVSLFQFDTTCRSLIALQPDLEDQQYAATTTSSTGATRTQLTTPAKGIIVRTAGAIIQSPHGSSLLSLVELAASVADVAVFDPVTFAGTYGTNKAVTITGATKASPCVITAVNTFANGQNVYISGVVEMTQLNGNSYEIKNVTGTTFELVDPYSTINVDSSAFTTYSTSGGTATPVMADAVINAQSNLNFRFRGVKALNTGCGNMCANLSRDADIWKDDKHYKGTLVSTSDWEIDGRGESITIASGTATVTAEKVNIAGEGAAADTLTTLKYATAINGYDGFKLTLVNSNAYIIDLVHGTTMFFKNNRNYALGEDDAVSFIYSEAVGGWVEVTSAASPQVITFTSTDATPTVANGTIFKTAGTTTITDFDDGVVGQTIMILATATITITNSAAILLNGATDYIMTDTDTLTLTMFNDQVWQEVARSVN